MAYPREVLNQIKWGDGDLSQVLITYVNRGAPGDVARINGEDIVELGRSFFTIGESEIPYHRIVKIEKNGEEVFRA
jgi:hypothetical protein